MLPAEKPAASSPGSCSQQSREKQLVIIVENTLFYQRENILGLMADNHDLYLIFVLI
jgi:hypothetical protein